MWDENGKLYRMCVLGKIIGAHYKGTDKQIRYGTPYFSAGTKVYCIFMYGGMGHQQVRVLGKLRKSSRIIDVVIATNLVKNYRLKKVFEPRVIAFIDKYQPVDDTATIAENMFQELNRGHKEIMV